jgi:EpsI family protein
MLTRAAVVFLCLATASVVIARAQQTERVPIRAPFGRFPMQLEDWHGIQEPPLDTSVLTVLGVDDYLYRDYFTPDRSNIGLYIGYYASQRQGDTMHSPLNCLPGSGWEPVSKRTIQIAVATPGTAMPNIAINRYVVEKGLDRVLVLYWYQSHGRVTASEYWSKWYLIRDAVRLNRTDGAMIRIMAPITPTADGEQRAEDLAIRFVKSFFPTLNNFLPV